MIISPSMEFLHSTNIYPLPVQVLSLYNGKNILGCLSANECVNDLKCLQLARYFNELFR